MDRIAFPDGSKDIVKLNVQSPRCAASLLAYVDRMLQPPCERNPLVQAMTEGTEKPYADPALNTSMLKLAVRMAKDAAWGPSATSAK